MVVKNRMVSLADHPLASRPVPFVAIASTVNDGFVRRASAIWDCQRQYHLGLPMDRDFLCLQLAVCLGLDL